MPAPKQHQNNSKILAFFEGLPYSVISKEINNLLPRKFAFSAFGICAKRRRMLKRQKKTKKRQKKDKKIKKKTKKRQKKKKKKEKKKRCAYI